MNMDFESIDVHKLLPQQPPFIMVDKLIYFDQHKTTTSLIIGQDNIFVENGIFTSSGLIENIAQTCAVRMGYINQYIHKENVKLGFIGSIRNLEIIRYPKVGERLTTSITIIEEIFQMTLVLAETRIGDETIVTSEMKIALSNIDSKAN